MQTLTESKYQEECKIKFSQVSLEYNLFYDNTKTLKEKIVNFFHKKDYAKVEDRKLLALDKVDFEVSHGERVGIIGLNGAGKSTILKLMSNLFLPTSGQVEIVGSVQPLIEIGAGFNPEFSGRENIYLNGCMLGFTRKQIRGKEQEIVEFSELAKFIDVPVKYYSSGMSVRLAFTIATIISPEILIMDEMLSAGDLHFIEKAKKRMDHILTQAKILVICSHDLGLIQQVTNRTLVLAKGKIVFDGDSKAAVAYYCDLVSKMA